MDASPHQRPEGDLRGRLAPPFTAYLRTDRAGRGWRVAWRIKPRQLGGEYGAGATRKELLPDVQFHLPSPRRPARGPDGRATCGGGVTSGTR